MKTRRALLISGLLAIILTSLFRGGSGYAATVTVGTTADENNGSPPCSLREALLSTNGDTDEGGCSHSGTYGADTIILPGGAPYVLSFTNVSQEEDLNESGDLDITDDSNSTTITGDGPGTTIVDAADIDRVFEI